MNFSSYRSVRRASCVALIVGAAALAGCGSDSDPDNVPAKAGACPHGGLKFGIEPFEDPAKITPAAKLIAESVAKKIDCPITVQVVEQYSAEVLAMENGKLDIAMFGPLGFVFAHQRAGAQAVASFATSDGKLSSYKSGLWVAKDSPITTVKQLSGASLALTEQGSTSGDALPRQALRDAGLEDRDVKITYTGGPPQAVLALTKRKVDAAAINTNQQQLARENGTFDPTKYREIWTSAAIPSDPLTVRKDLDPKLKKKIAAALIDLPPATIAQMGKFLAIDPPGPLVAVTKAHYQALFDLAETLGLSLEDV